MLLPTISFLDDYTWEGSWIGDPELTESADRQWIHVDLVLQTVADGCKL